MLLEWILLSCGVFLFTTGWDRENREFNERSAPVVENTYQEYEVAADREIEEFKFSGKMDTELSVKEQYENELNTKAELIRVGSLNLSDSAILLWGTSVLGIGNKEVFIELPTRLERFTKEDVVIQDPEIAWKVVVTKTSPIGFFVQRIIEEGDKDGVENLQFSWIIVDSDYK